jgi:hypothetical protein
MPNTALNGGIPAHLIAEGRIDRVIESVRPISEGAYT